MVENWWGLNPSNKASIKVKNMGKEKDGVFRRKRGMGALTKKGKYATFTEKEALVDVRKL